MSEGEKKDLNGKIKERKKWREENIRKRMRKELNTKREKKGKEEILWKYKRGKEKKGINWNIWDLGLRKKRDKSEEMYKLRNKNSNKEIAKTGIIIKYF